ncbi:MAG: PIN domain-containing protein [Candidatus Omnitrophota bacterium]
MGKEKIYLDTSVVSAYYDKRVKERQRETVKFWKEILSQYHACVSDITIQEIINTPDDALRKRLQNLIEGVQILKVNRKINVLANNYIEEGIFANKYIYDAMHVAVASFYEVPYLLSWNFRHLVKVKTRKLVSSVNILKGFREIEIILPTEL